MDVQTLGTYVVVGVGLVTIVKGLLDIINIIKAWMKSENSQNSPTVIIKTFSLGKKINALILSIGVVVMLSGVGWLSYNNSLFDEAKKEYFRSKDLQLQYNIVFAQKFEQYFKEKYVQPPSALIGISFILLSLTFFVGSISKPITSTFQATALFTTEILGLLIGVWLVISNQ